MKTFRQLIMEKLHFLSFAYNAFSLTISRLIFSFSQIYWLGPILGALLGTYAYQVLFAEKQSEKKLSIYLIDQKPFNVLPQSDNAYNISNTKV